MVNEIGGQGWLGALLAAPAPNYGLSVVGLPVFMCA